MIDRLLKPSVRMTLFADDGRAPEEIMAGGESLAEWRGTNDQCRWVAEHGVPAETSLRNTRFFRLTRDDLKALVLLCADVMSWNLCNSRPGSAKRLYEIDDYRHDPDWTYPTTVMSLAEYLIDPDGRFIAAISV